MSNQTQSPTQEKEWILRKKYVKRHLQQNNLLGRQPQFSKLVQKIIKRMTPVIHFQPNPLPLAGQRYIGKECLNIEKIPSRSSTQN